MRFIIRDQEQRLFLPERYCFRGSVKDWISIGNVGDLASLCRRYLGHLGKDSIYELY